MTSDPETANGPGGDDLAARITGALDQRAAQVAVDDRLHRITDGAETPGAGLSDRPVPGRRHPAAGRLVFAAAAVVVAVALAAALWQRGGPEPLSPASDPTTDDAAIYPILDTATLQTLGLGPASDVVVQRGEAQMSGSALVLGRFDGDHLGEVITVSVLPTPAITNGEAIAGTAESATLPVSGLGGVTRSIGGRSVRLPYGASAPADLTVWLAPDTPQTDIDTLQAYLDDALVVRSLTYVNQEATWGTFQAYYADQPEVLDLVDPSDLPTSFLVDLEVDDQTHGRRPARRAGGDAQRDPGGPGYRLPALRMGRSRRHDRGRRLSRQRATGRRRRRRHHGDTGPGWAARCVRDRALPEGLVIVAGPSVPVDEPLPWISVTYGGGDSRVMITGQAVLDPRSVHTRARVGGRDGYLSEQDGAFTLAWPIDDQGRWAQLVGTGLSSDQALALAGAVTFTDEATWTGRYPAQPATTIGTVPPSTITDVTVDSGIDTTTTEP